MPEFDFSAIPRPAVELIQHGLTANGQAVAIDGIFGQKTGDAYARYLRTKMPGYERKLNERSRRNLAGVHSDLVAAVEAALIISPIDFVVTEGLRTRDRQRELFEKGASSTMNSRHLTGHAIDVAARIGDEIRWDWPLYEQIARAFKMAAHQLGVSLEWGGDWTSLRDGPHFQLCWDRYPAADTEAT